MGYFENNTIRVRIVIYDEDDNIINRATPHVDNMRTAHKVGRNLRDKTNGGYDYEVVQL